MRLSACLLLVCYGIALSEARGIIDSVIATAKTMFTGKSVPDNKDYLLKPDAKINDGLPLIAPVLFHARFNPYDYTTYGVYDSWKDARHTPMDRSKLGGVISPFFNIKLPPAKATTLSYQQVGHEMQ